MGVFAETFSFAHCTKLYDTILFKLSGLVEKRP